MNNIKNYEEYINEGIFNLAKTRKFPTFGDKGIDPHRNDRKYKNWSELTDMYSIYDLSKKDIGKYLNTWIVGQVAKSKEGDTLRDEMWTVKKLDEESARHLYNRIINPVSINIMYYPRPDSDYYKLRKEERAKRDLIKEKLYSMKAQIHSIDDSSYGAWFENTPFDELAEIRKKLMEWLNTFTGKNLLNGEEFLEICKSMGATQTDYN